MNKKKVTNELKLIFKYILDNIVTEYPCDYVTSQHIIIAMIETNNSIANKILTKFLRNEQLMNIEEQCYSFLSTNSKSIKTLFNENDIIISPFITNAYEFIGESTLLNSGMLLASLMNSDEYSSELFKREGVTLKHIKNDVINKDEVNNNSDTPKKHTKKENKKKSNGITSNNNLWENKKYIGNEVEKYLININKQASEGKIDASVGTEEIINSIFRILLKKNNNNIIIVGDNGVGKTTLVKHIANLITQKKVPKPFKDKIIVKVDFNTLISGMMFKGAFESRIKTIVEDAKKNGDYIFFIDDIDVLLENSKYGNNDAEQFLNIILNENKIHCITTASTKGYSKLLSDLSSISKLTKLTLEEVNEEIAFKAITAVKQKYEDYHEVSYSEDVIKLCIKLSKQYFNEYKLPGVVLDMIDEIGAESELKQTDSEEITQLMNEIEAINKEKEELNNLPYKDYEKIDEIIKKEINLKSLLSLKKKSQEIDKEFKQISEEDIYNFVSKKINIPLAQVKQEEKDKLKKINDTLKAIVIGQDEAIDEVCRVIKRQRIGLSNQNKPSVLMFTGSTGTGKTYLAKKLAENIFGDEKYMVRLDMSEFSDKMSASKLIGSSAGYIGYDDGGVLTEAIKKNKYCVLLLDECEKADESVFNMFLQVFDDGRLTDNKGVVVDFRNVIIIMTSNTGAQEVSERKGGIGFCKDKTNVDNFEKAIYEKAIKRKFKPEFINRIDKIVYFNKLSESDLKEIIRIEIKKVDSKLNEIGYSLHKNIYEPFINKISSNISNKHEYGARPILREIQILIEDKITDLLIEKNIKKGHKFNIKELL